MIVCPAPPTVNCSAGLYEWNFESVWMREEQPTGYGPIRWIVCSENDEDAQKVSVAVKSGATCGGRAIEPEVGWFDGERIDDTEAWIVKEGGKESCYREYNCDWGEEYPVGCYMWKSGSDTDLVFAYVSQRQCRQEGEVTTGPIQDDTFISAEPEYCDPAYWGE